MYVRSAAKLQLLKRNTYVLAPFLCWLVNSSLENGTVPSSFKSAYITPLLKKAADVTSYRPTSNLSAVSKLLRRIVAKQLVNYLRDNNLLPVGIQSQSLDEDRRAQSPIQHSPGAGFRQLGYAYAARLVGSVRQRRPRQTPAASYGLGGVVADWFASYLSGHTQYVRSSATMSSPSAVVCGVPQGSVLGPILFLLYVADLLQLVKRH